MIIDGHAHVYDDNRAEKIVPSFTQLHHMEPAPPGESAGKDLRTEKDGKSPGFGSSGTGARAFEPGPRFGRYQFS